MALHQNLTDPELHEPKGASTAPSRTVYIADGSGSGDWEPPQASDVQVEAGTDGLLADDLQAILQDIYTKIAALDLRVTELETP